jgi:2,5-diamino-6-(ribosylamino)-4(3H)-pyrimidinone 5'-phosphate reductase
LHLSHFVPGTRPYLDLEFPPPPPGRPYVITNMVGSIDGKAVIEGNEQGLGSGDDKDRMQELRAHADAVMNGAGTLRASGASSRIRDEALVEWRRKRGKAEQPLGVIVTRRAEFELRGPYFKADSGLRALVFGSEISEQRKRELEAPGTAKVVPISTRPDSILEVLRHLREREGVALLCCEGGPTLNAQLVEHDALDEFFLTLGPELVGGRDTLTVLEGDWQASKDRVRHLELLSAIANDETGELYLRYRVTGSG